MNQIQSNMNGQAMSKSGPLAGLRVLDLTIALAGPMCTQRMGEMGADIVKIEAPGGGDFSRYSTMAGITKFGDATTFVTLNRNKRSLILDLKSDAGREVLYRMVKDADVLVQNFRPRVASKLGIDYATLSAINPRLVYGSISGYGEDGPLKDRPGQDLLLQSFAGLTMNAGRSTELPHPSPLYMVDVSASHHLTEGVLAALVARATSGRGQEIRVTMVSAIMEMQVQELTSFMSSEGPPRRSASPQASIYMEPPYGIYQCKDAHLALAQVDLNVLSDVIEVPVLKQLKASRPRQTDSDQLMAWRDDIYNAVATRLRENTAAHWDELLTQNGLWCGPVNDYATFLAHPQTQRYLTTMTHSKGGEYRTVAPAIRFSEDPTPSLRGSPRYGEHSREVLLEAGFSVAEVDKLFADNVAVSPVVDA
ncbi:crotonobetainyl-CoA:carnitine CoA-transferase CaiB-like acyl-CoA transferase [Devosia sp. UYZn731]|uniref:CaiB/BaiF CoA transferase family protein n=1 Tax=Devosia sp. UYZn731 TaxID=3156345 RepID=UPI003390BE05